MERYASAMIQAPECSSMLLLDIVVCLMLSSPAAASPQRPAEGGDQEAVGAGRIEDEVATDQDEQPKSHFERINAKAEKLFEILPVPLVYYSSQTGTVYGLAKFNLFHLNKEDEVSQPSKLEGVLTVSSHGQFIVGAGATLFFQEDRGIYLGDAEYREFPEYLFGIGNSVSVDDREEITTSSYGIYNQLLRRVGKSVYVGGVVDYLNVTEVVREDSSFLDEREITGRDGGISVGLGATLIHDSRDNRHNAASGSFAHFTASFYSSSFGSDFSYKDFSLDLRKYFNPWRDHVLAMQAYGALKEGDVPFYSLAMLGGPDRMRGYYQGALRDKAILDAQIEYRLPLWSIFGATAFLGAGRVAESISDMSTDDIRLSYGFGLRIMVDRENRANLRIDFGFGPDYGPEKVSVSSVDIRFTEAF